VPVYNDTAFYYFARKKILINQMDLQNSALVHRAVCGWGEDEQIVFGGCFED
jgi:hypothetical protein